MAFDIGKDFGVTCCFCNEGIEDLGRDPSEVSVMINVDKAEDQQVEQVFWCHSKCFRTKLHADIKPSLTIDLLDL